MSVFVCAPVTASTIAVAVDVGKNCVALSVTDASRHRLLGPVEFAMTAPAFSAVLDRITGVIPAGSDVAVKVGIEAAGHYHRPMLDAAWRPGWEVLELNPAQVTEQRRVAGRRRVKTDAIDLEAITELVLAGRGVPVASRNGVIGELQAWAAHRTRRVLTRTATKNQLLGQLDRCFPGLTLALPDVLGTKVGRLVAAHFADPKRLASMGAARFVSYASHRDLRVDGQVADRLVAAARNALPTGNVAVARQILAADLGLLADLDAQVSTAETVLAGLLPKSPFSTLTTVPRWGTVRVANYAAAVGDPSRWPGYQQLYRASGLSPQQYESAGKRRDGGISREGSVPLRRALIDLGMGLWTGPAGTDYVRLLRARGKHGGVIMCALAHRANKIAFALTRDHATFDAARWG